MAGPGCKGSPAKVRLRVIYPPREGGGYDDLYVCYRCATKVRAAVYGAGWGYFCSAYVPEKNK